MIKHGAKAIHLIIVAITIAVMLFVASPATADDGGYPYAGYNGPGSNAMLSDWYDNSGHDLSQYRYNYRNCTDFVAWKLAAVNGFAVSGSMGNAANWGQWALDHSYTVDMNPVVGSVAWQNGSFGYGYGHVAYVVGVNSARKTVDIQEYNWFVGGVFDGLYHTETVAISSRSGYIHFKDIGSSGGGSSSTKPYKSDVNTDGTSDLVITTNEPAGTKGWVLKSNQGFASPAMWWDGTGYGWSGVTPLAGDVDGDSDADLVYLTNEGANGTKAFVAKSTTTGFVAPELWWNGVGWGYGGIKPSLGDVNYDGKADLVLTTSQPGGGSAANVLVSSGQGFGAPVQWWQDLSVGWSNISPFVGDFNGDKKADFLFLANNNNAGTRAYVAVSSGSAFGVPLLWWDGIGWGYGGIKAAIGDADNTGDADLVIVTSEPGGAKGWVLRSTQIGFIAPAMWWDGTGYGWSGVTPLVGDVDGDSDADFVYMTDEGANGTKVFVAKSTTTGFAAPQLWWNGTGWGYAGIKPVLN